MLEGAQEVAEKFGGGILWRFEQAPRGYWWSRGILMEDELSAIEVDIPDTPAAKEWITNYARKF